MRRLLVALSVLLGLTASAFAADMSLRAPPPVVNTTPWAGWYAGVHVGGLFDTTFNPDIADLASFKPSGFMYGGQFGHNWQKGVFVFGVEGDVTAVNRGATQTMSEAVDATARLNYMASVRGRLGVTLFNNDTLIYFTGGAAWANATGDLTDGRTTVTAGSNHFGPVIGGGIEWMVIQNWVLRAEMLHYMLGKNSYAFGPTVNVNLPVDLTANVARVGLSYKFGT